ncbi:glycosyltransferase [Arthrobacter rhombi]|uniref:4,4'-diaponeurosporenoate glycosyltransferase n=1 Tax=Arthrobacter rhombi TaxID=71253 RepID=A0A1R4GRQ8_9MICC|nr:glycosyltransferase [Arthrobacter rhombi]SJM70753.1 Glycosyl transferase, group 2 family protein [Arthrobacter rhombi]
MSSGAAALEQIAIVLPIRDEEQRLDAAVEHILAAMDRWESAGPGRTRLVLVLDSCTDGSPQIASRAADADTRISIVTTAVRCVGAARALGVRTALAGIPSPSFHRQWIASTDADTRVPAAWLEVFAEAAEAGADVLLGTVEPDLAELGRYRYYQWLRRYTRSEGHGHIHGANLGVRASAYVDAGGFPSVTDDEDVGLVDALRSRGADIRSSGKLHVVTSGRVRGRAEHGFAEYLAHLPVSDSVASEHER